jgi:hypothetical protein
MLLLLGQVLRQLKLLLLLPGNLLLLLLGCCL